MEQDKATAFDNGAVYDEQTGDHLGEIETEGFFAVKTIPFKLSVFHDGMWHIYKLDEVHPNEEIPVIPEEVVDPLKDL